MKKGKKMLRKRSFGVIIVNSIDSNYNGNPDEDNMPRLTPEGQGIISPQCEKHRIRDLVSDPNDPVCQFLHSYLDLDVDNFSVWESLLKGFNVDTPLEAMKEWRNIYKESGEAGLCRRFWDIRTFGVTALEENESTKKGKKSDKKVEEAIKHLRFTRKGCITVSPLTSVLPVEIVVQTLTKENSMRKELMDQQQGDMAPLSLKYARHALFVGTYTINPSKSHYTGTTEKDIEVFKALLPYAFSNSTSALRSNVDAVKIYHAEHKNPLGSFSESEFLEFCRPVVNDDNLIKNWIPSTSIKDYTLKTIDQVKDAFEGVDVQELTKSVIEEAYV